MSFRRSFTMYTAGGFALAGAVLAGCGGDDGGDDATGGDVEATAAYLASAASATTEQTSYTMTVDVAFESPELPDGIELTMDAGVDTEAHLPPFPADLGDVVDALSASPEAEEFAGFLESGQLGDDFSVEVIANSTDVYLHAPVLGALLGSDGDKWIKFPASQADGLEEQAAASGGLEEVPTADDLAKAFEDIDATVEDLGTEEVDGVETTHLRTEIDLSRLADDPGLGLSTDDAAQLDGAVVPVDIYVDEDGLVRKVAIEYAQDEGAATFSITFSDFGEELGVEVPAADEVTDSDELEQLLAGLQSSMG